MAAALVAYNCTPHSSHNFTPMHVFFTTLETALLPSAREHTAEVNRKKASPLEMVKTREAMKQAVQDNFQKYHERMDGSGYSSGHPMPGILLSEVFFSLD